MTTEAGKPKGKVEKGQVWFHQGRTNEPYSIDRLLDNATGFESTGAIADPVVVYIQQYDGKIAKKGKVWGRLLSDFLGSTEVNGQQVPNFVLKKGK
jgi:hypothetical protein